MSEINEEIKRVEDWLTQGRPRVFRTRGGVRTRGAAALAPGVTVKRIESVDELLKQLKEGVPEVPWVIVVDGSVDAFAEDVCLRARQARESSKFWLVGAEGEIPEKSAIAAMTPLRLNPQSEDDLRFLKNLVADFVVVSAEPKTSQEERVRRWLPQARYILAEDLDESLIKKLRTPEIVGGSKAEIFFIGGGE